MLGHAMLRAGSGATSYADVVAADAPIAWWRLQETSGTTLIDAAPNPVALAVYGWPTLALPGIPGANAGKAIKINGASDYAQASPAKLQIATFSAELWFYQSALNAAEMCLLDTYTTAPKYPLYLGLGQTNAGSKTNPQFSQYGGSWVALTASSRPAAGAWHHLCATYDAAAQIGKLYVDGTLAASGTVDQVTTAQTGLVVRLGQYSNTGYNVTSGVILAEPALYDKVLPAERVLAHYKAGIAA